MTPMNGMRFSNFSVLNPQPSIRVHPNVETGTVSQACANFNKSAMLAQQQCFQMPFPSISAVCSKRYENLLENQSAHESHSMFALDVFSGDPLKGPEWKEMLQSTCSEPSVSLYHRIKYLELFLVLKAKAIFVGFCVQFD